MSKQRKGDSTSKKRRVQDRFDSVEVPSDEESDPACKFVGNGHVQEKRTRNEGLFKLPDVNFFRKKFGEDAYVGKAEVAKLRLVDPKSKRDYIEHPTDKIIAHRLRPYTGVLEYLVVWEHTPSNDAEGNPIPPFADEWVEHFDVSKVDVENYVKRGTGAEVIVTPQRSDATNRAIARLKVREMYTQLMTKLETKAASE